MNVDTGTFEALRGERAGLGERVADVDRRNEDAARSALMRADCVLTEIVHGLRRLEAARFGDSPPALRVITGGGVRGRRAAARQWRFRVVDGGRP